MNFLKYRPGCSQKAVRPARAAIAQPRNMPRAARYAEIPHTRADAAKNHTRTHKKLETAASLRLYSITGAYCAHKISQMRIKRD